MRPLALAGFVLISTKPTTHASLPPLIQLWIDPRWTSTHDGRVDRTHAAGLLRLDVCLLNDRPPLLDLLGLIRREVFGGLLLGGIDLLANIRQPLP